MVMFLRATVITDDHENEFTNDNKEILIKDVSFAHYLVSCVV